MNALCICKHIQKVPDIKKDSRINVLTVIENERIDSKNNTTLNVCDQMISTDDTSDCVKYPQTNVAFFSVKKYANRTFIIAYTLKITKIVNKFENRVCTLFIHFKHISDVI